VPHAPLPGQLTQYIFYIYRKGEPAVKFLTNFILAKKLADFSGLYPRRELSAAIALLFQSMDMIFWLPQAEAALAQAK
jgi:hypothetical protein